MPDLRHSIAEFRESLAGLPPPVIVFCKSHSGSRLLARLMMAGGIWLGNQRNDSEDSADFLRVVEPAVLRHYPDFSRLNRDGDPSLIDVAMDVVARHVRGLPKGRPWGWKLCETSYVLPLFHALFPNASFVHLIRDGRDVAFCNHVPPVEDFWRKIYFGTQRIHSWRGLALTMRAYRRQPHVFNAHHWVSSVTTARNYGAMLGRKYIEITYEDIVCDPLGQMRHLFSALAVELDETTLRRRSENVYSSSIGKFRRMPLVWQRQSRAVLSPTLETFGYGVAETAAPQAMHHLRDTFAAISRRLGKQFDAS